MVDVKIVGLFEDLRTDIDSLAQRVERLNKRLCTKRSNMIKQKHWWIGWSILLIISIIFVFWSFNMSEHLESHNYEFYFDLMTKDFVDETNNKLQLNNFVFYYDFTSDSGRISFDFDKREWDLSIIEVKFPSRISGYDIYTEKNKIKLEINATMNLSPRLGGLWSSNHSELVVEDFNRTFNSEKFVIDFESDMKPNGRFSFYHNRYDSLSGHHEYGNVNLILGDDYECLFPCVENLWKIEENQYSYDRDIRLKFLPEGRDTNKVFRINAISNNKVKLKNVLLAGGISLFVSLLIVVFSMLYPKSNN